MAEISKITVFKDDGAIPVTYDIKDRTARQMAEDAETAAKAYTDEYHAIAREEARAYADTQDVEVLNNAKAYTDEKHDLLLDTIETVYKHDAEAYTDEKDAETLAAAKAYADEKDAETLASAKTFAEEVILPTAQNNAIAEAESMDFNVLQNAKTYTNQTFSNAFRGELCGDVVRIDDVSPVVHEPVVTVRSRNMITLKNIAEKTYGGVVHRVENDTLHLNGTASLGYTYSATNQNEIYLKKGATYAMSLVASGGIETETNVPAYFHLEDSDGSWTETIYIPALSVNMFTKTFTATKDVSAHVRLWIEKGPVYTDAEIRLQLEEGSTATGYAPRISDLTTVAVTRYGKNLHNIPDVPESTNVGATFRIENGVLYINGKISSYAFRTNSTIYLKKGTYTQRLILSHAITGGNISYSMKNATTGATIPRTVTIKADSGVTDATATLTFTEDTYVTVGLWAYSGIVANNLEVRMQLEAGAAATEYEPYTEPVTYTPDAEGNVSGVESLAPTMTLLTDTPGVIIDCEYNRDSNKVYEQLMNAIISLGGNV